MQDNYVGDIGDYGKYGLLRTICSQGISLSVNWYKSTPKKESKQNDGKHIEYLSLPHFYKSYDPDLFDSLYNIVCIEKDRHIERIEKENLFSACFFSEEIPITRTAWHQDALEKTANTSSVFLDPDNGLETLNMFQKGTASEKHVKWAELKSYYERGQNVILYQHRPKMTKKEKCIADVMDFERNFLKSDQVMLLEFPKYTNRFYFFFIHKEFQADFENICDTMIQNWSKNDFCRRIIPV